MPIEAECPLCGHKGQVPDKFNGKQVKCPECCNLFLASGPTVPAAAGVKAGGPAAPKKAGDTHHGTGKSPTSGSGSGQHKAVAGSAQQKAVSSGSGSGQHKAVPGSSGHHKAVSSRQPMATMPAISLPGKSAQGAGKSPGSGSGSGQQKIAPKPGSGQGVQKKPGSAQGVQKKPAPAKGKAGARNGAAGDPFSNLTFDEPAGGGGNYRRRRRNKSLINFLALLFLLAFTLAIGAGAIFAYHHFTSGGTVDEVLALFKSAPRPTEEAAPEPTEPEPKVVQPVASREPVVVQADKAPAFIDEPLNKIKAEVRIVSAAVEIPMAKGMAVDKDKKLIIKLQIDNKGNERILFQGYGTIEDINKRHPPMLTDPTNAPVKQATFDAGVIVDGQVLAETIDVGKSLNDVIVFDLPPGFSTYVKLELSNENITGHPGSYTFLIPTRMISGNLPGADPKFDPKIDPKMDPKKPAETDVPREPLLLAQLRTQLKVKQPPVRTDAAKMIAEFGPNGVAATKDLIAALQGEKDAEVRLAVVECLGKIGPGAKDAIPTLIEHLKTDKLAPIRAESARALALMGDAGKAMGLPALNEMLKKETDNNVQVALRESVKVLEEGKKE
jgi:hypothetical protein